MGAFAPGAGLASQGTPPGMEDPNAGGSLDQFAPPPDSSIPSGPTQGFDGGAMAGAPNTGMAPVDQNAGMFETLQEIEQGLKGSVDFLITLSGQFPGLSEICRRMLQPLQQAQEGLVPLVEALAVAATQPTPAAPRTAF